MVVKQLGLILDVPLELSIEAGRRKMKLGDILKLTPGSIIKLDRAMNDSLNLLVNGKRVAQGEMVTTGDNRVALRILTVVEKTERVNGLENDT